MDKKNIQTRKKIKEMTPIEQLKATTSKINLSQSSKENVYDWSDDFHFIFDIEITKGGTWDVGTEFSPPTWTAEDKVVVTALRVLETENFEDVELSEGELDEIAKELLTKIEIE